MTPLVDPLDLEPRMSLDPAAAPLPPLDAFDDDVNTVLQFRPVDAPDDEDAVDVPEPHAAEVDLELPEPVIEDDPAEVEDAEDALESAFFAEAEPEGTLEPVLREVTPPRRKRKGRGLALGCAAVAVLGLLGVGVVGVAGVGAAAAGAVWLSNQPDVVVPERPAEVTAPAPEVHGLDEVPLPPAALPTEAPTASVARPEPPPARPESTRVTAKSAPTPAAPAPAPERTEAATAPAPTPPPAAPAATGRTARVATTGGARVILVSSGGRRLTLPADVPAGRWEILATFPGEPEVSQGALRVSAGRDVTVRCNAAMGICRAR